MIIGSVIERHEKVSSTNTTAAIKIRNEKPAEGMIISASYQDGGRGQQGNKWESEAGKNLLISIILYPSMVSPINQFILSQMVSLSVFDLVSIETPDVKIKWPNDIYVRDDKIAGILIENSIIGDAISSCIVGIGLNVNQETFSSTLPNPVSLTKITGKKYDLDKVIADLARALDKRYLMIINGDTEKLSSDYHDALYRCNEWHVYKDNDGKFTGMIMFVRKDGMIILKRKDGSVREYAFRDIEYFL